jgi:hypothetical protein
MKAWLQFIVLMCAIATITAIASHSVVSWLRIEASPSGYWHVGPERARQSAFLAGSSLAGYALELGRISGELNLKIEGWGVAASSPSEWEQFQSRARETTLTILVVSAYDLNEFFLSDFRADVVPLGQTIEDLWHSGADWSYSKRLLSSYPLSYLRELYPTAGRSDGVMVGIREKLNRMGPAIFSMESESSPTLTFNEASSLQDKKTQKVTNWSPARILRRLAVLRSLSQGKHGFDGPKKLALLRMLRWAKQRGHTVVVVLPVSPIYAKEFLTSEANREFEAALAEAQHSVPEVNWIRLDQVNELNSNEYFVDFVHMNSYGKMIATEEFLRHFAELTSLQ